MPDLNKGPGDVDDLPSPDDALPEIIIYSHSALIYWWPVWLFGYIAAAVTYTTGDPFIAENGDRILVQPSPGIGLAYIGVLITTLLITNGRLRGIYSIVLLLCISLVFVSLAWAGLLDDLARILPQISVHMNAGFYMVMSTALLVIWMLAFFVFDRLEYWRVRPGQLTQEQWIGDSAESFDTRGMLFEKHGEDFLRHRILGLGAGDLMLSTAGAKERTIAIPDVLFVDRTVNRVQRLIAIEPSDLE
ncbi:MAG: hypothetical protein APF80_02650 [Alphaproteobacteria bacterium BRH_c36]|nr:MAG: hypothetical protein APF80_02650 [Alphaproteobacteria bacterium BRH_c36]